MKKTYLFVLAVCCSLGMLLSGSAFGQTYTTATAQSVLDTGEYTPYSSDIVVAGGPVAIEAMTVTLSAVTHTFPLDMDFMLVAPNGDNFIIMSDAIGTAGIVALDLTLADFAGADLTGATASGTYLPTNNGAGDVLPGAAPLDQGNTSFAAAFGGDDSNGTWTLFCADDVGGDGGDITGWEISFFPNVPGCTDSATPACNFDPLATLDDGSCDYSCVGCTDDGLGTIVPAVFPGTAACDYDPLATVDNGACDYSCFGCTDPLALNNDPLATSDDGSCVVAGCLDAPVNFQLCYDDNSTSILTLTENNAGEGVTLEFLSGETEAGFDDLNIYDGPDNLSPLLATVSGDATGLIVQSTGATISIEIISDGSFSCAGNATQAELDINAYCTSVVLGCTDDGTAGPFAPAAACNYDPAALNDDGSCEYTSCAGCTDPGATNYSGVGATIDDGSCLTCLAGELLVTVDMRDSFGDGWDGFEYILSDGGGIIGQNDLENATSGDGVSAGADGYCLAPGCYSFDIIGAGFVGEIGYTVSDNIGNTYLDVDGAAITGQGLNIGTGNACGFNGCTDPTAINYDINADVDDASCLYPPANDEICNAEGITCGSSILGTTALSTDAETLVGSTCSGIDITSTGVWYQFNALADQQIFVSTCASTSGIDSKIHVYEAADCLSALACVAGNDDGCGAGVFTSEVVFNATAGNSYFIYVSEFGTGTGLEFNLDVTCIDCVSGVPGNDDCANATPVPAFLAGVPATATQSICCASAAVENVFAPAFSTTYDVWFSVNSGTFDALAISLANVDNALVGITIYDGSDCLALNAAAGGGPVVGEIAGDLSDFVAVTPSTDYLIQAWTTDPAGCGDITLSVTGNNLGCTDLTAINFDPLATLDDGSCDYTGVTPFNDECATALPLACNTTISGSTGGATATGAPLSIAGCNATPGSGVWYTFVGTGELHTLSTCGSVIDSQINVYESDAGCAGVFTCAASATEGFVDCGFFDQDDVQVQFVSTAGLSYYVYVGAEDVDADPLTDDNGLFDLTFDCVPAVPGCTEPNACNYDVANNIDDGSCDYFACACALNPTGTAVQLQMVDSFGDGWGTGTYEIFDATTATSIATGTLDDALVVVDEDNNVGGDNGFDMLCLDDGCYEIVVGGDTFDGEISWTIVDAADAVIATGLAPETVSFTIGAAVCGCTDDGTAGPFAPAEACNYDALATVDDGSCEYETCAGCTDGVTPACNFDAAATIDDGSCCLDNCVTFDMTDSFGDGWDGAVYTVFDAVTDAVVASGDIDTAQSGDLGNGTDVLCLTDGCYYLSITAGAFPGEISWVLSGINGGIETGGAPVEQLYFSVGTGDCVVGCATEIACNYDAATIIEDCTLCEFASCVGCTYATAENQTVGATIDDGSCTFAGSACPADFNNDGIVNAGDLLAFLGEFGTTCP